jgi:hypothetical protein
VAETMTIFLKDTNSDAYIELDLSIAKSQEFTLNLKIQNVQERVSLSVPSVYIDGEDIPIEAIEAALISGLFYAVGQLRQGSALPEDRDLPSIAVKFNSVKGQLNSPDTTVCAQAITIGIFSFFGREDLITEDLLKNENVLTSAGPSNWQFQLR